MYLHNPTPTRTELRGIPEGPAGVRVTLAAMADYARKGKVSQRVRQLALTLIQNVPHKGYREQVRILFEYVRDQIQYVKDIVGVETLHTPDKVLEFEAGDCDDKSTLLAAMLLSIGHPARFVAIGFQPFQYSHVYVETKIGSEWVPLETTENVRMGWSPPGVRARMVFPI